MNDKITVSIESRDYWFKIVEFLQQNWSLVDHREGTAIAWFFDDASRVFDQIVFPSSDQAISALRRNGFRRFADDPRGQEDHACARAAIHPRVALQ